MDRWLRTIMDSWKGLIAATRSEQAFRRSRGTSCSGAARLVIAPDICKRLVLIAATGSLRCLTQYCD